MSLMVALLAALVVLAAPPGRAESALRARLQVCAMDLAVDHRSSWRRPFLAVAARLGLGRHRAGPASDAWLPVLDQLAASLRAGLPPTDALALTTKDSGRDVRRTLESVLDAAREGRQCAPAWARAARATGRLELQLLARSWAISEQLGAPLADAVDSTARSARSQTELSSRLATATAGARTTATILSLLPVAGVGVALLMGIGPADLYGSPTAVVSLAVGLLLIAAGRVVVNGMVDRVTDPR